MSVQQSVSQGGAGIMTRSRSCRSVLTKGIRGVPRLWTPGWTSAGKPSRLFWTSYQARTRSSAVPQLKTALDNLSMEGGITAMLCHSRSERPDTLRLGRLRATSVVDALESAPVTGGSKHELSYADSHAVGPVPSRHGTAHVTAAAWS